MADKKKIEEKKPEDEDKPVAKDGEEGAEGEEGAAEAAPKKKLPIKLILIVVGVLVLLGGGGSAAYFMGVFGGEKKEAAADSKSGSESIADIHAPASDTGKESKKSEGAVFYDLGEIMVNISGEGRRQTYLKLVVGLELESEKDKDAIDKLKPRIVDNFQTYLRELRLDDLRGSAGLYRLREELLFRVTDAVHPIKVRDVLFQQMLVQ